jgi:hypothetical protein
MKVDVHVPGSFGQEGAQALRLEAEDFDTLWVAETNHDPFLRSLLVAGATQRVRTGTCIAVALSRSPMTVAYTAYDLARYAQGRWGDIAASITLYTPYASDPSIWPHLAAAVRDRSGGNE